MCTGTLKLCRDNLPQKTFEGFFSVLMFLQALTKEDFALLQKVCVSTPPGKFKEVEFNIMPNRISIQ